MLAEAREHGLGVGVAFSRERRSRWPSEAANLGADLCLCMSIDPGYSGQEFLEDAYERIARTRELVDCFVQVDGGVKLDNVRRCTTPARTSWSSATASSRARISTRAYRRLVQALA